MTSHNSEILKIPRLPGRINAEQTAALLGFQAHDIPVLVRAKLIQPLGNPSQSAPKWFSSAEIEIFRQDSKFLARATKVISLRWQNRNSRLLKKRVAKAPLEQSGNMLV